MKVKWERNISPHITTENSKKVLSKVQQHHVVHCTCNHCSVALLHQNNCSTVQLVGKQQIFKKRATLSRQAMGIVKSFGNQNKSKLSIVGWIPRVNAHRSERESKTNGMQVLCSISSVTNNCNLANLLCKP